MFYTPGEIFDMWGSKSGTPYYLYFLIAPRKGEVCYVGITKQKFKNRLSQHQK